MTLNEMKLVNNKYKFQRGGLSRRQARFFCLCACAELTPQVNSIAVSPGCLSPDSTYWGPRIEAICLPLLSASTCGICSSVPVKCSLGSVNVTSKDYKRCTEQLATSGHHCHRELPLQWLTSRNFNRHFKHAYV